MKLKKPFIAAVILVFVVILAGCAPAVTVSSPNDTYIVTAVERAETFDGITAPAGETLLLIQLEGDKKSIETAEQDFFSYQKVGCQVSDGTYSAPCRSVAYAEDDDKLAVILIFEVPDSFAKKFSLIGDTIGVTEITLSR